LFIAELLCPKSGAIYIKRTSDKNSCHLNGKGYIQVYVALIMFMRAKEIYLPKLSGVHLKFTSTLKKATLIQES